MRSLHCSLHSRNTVHSSVQLTERNSVGCQNTRTIYMSDDRPVVQSTSLGHSVSTETQQKQYKLSEAQWILCTGAFISIGTWKLCLSSNSPGIDVSLNANEKVIAKECSTLLCGFWVLLLFFESGLSLHKHTTQFCPPCSVLVVPVSIFACLFSQMVFNKVGLGKTCFRWSGATLPILL